MRGRKIKTQSDVERYIAQGCGSGELEDYLPWIRVEDVASRGKSRKVPGIKVDRTYEVLSGLEYQYLNVLEFSENVVDIREQFPIFPTEAALEIACDLGIAYPKYPSTTVLFVMTTDFLITVADPDGSVRHVARTVKPEFNPDDAKKHKRIVEKLELERAIWAHKGVTDWAIVGPEALGVALPRNLELLRGGADRSMRIGKELRAKFLDHLAHFWSRDRNLSAVIRTAATIMQLPYLDGVRLFKHLAWHKFVTFDIRNVELKLTASCPEANFTDDVSKQKAA